MDYVAEALKSSAADALYKSLSVRGTITFDHNDAGTEWSSATINGATTIIAAPTNHPAAALYHELLHAKLKLDGYRQYLTIVSMSAKRRLLQHVCEPLDNELQHHRMIGEFLAAGFPADQFYNDEDVTAIKESRRALQGLKRDALPEEFLLPFLTVLAPGGVGSVEDRQRLKNLFRANSPRTRLAGTFEHRGMLCRVEQYGHARCRRNNCPNSSRAWIRPNMDRSLARLSRRREICSQAVHDRGGAGLGRSPSGAMRCH